MGHQQPIHPRQHFTLQQLQKSIHQLFNNTDQKFSPQCHISFHIDAILKNIQINLPIEMVQNKMKLNLTMLTIFYHQRFVDTLIKLINLLVQKLDEFNTRNFMLIKRQQFIFCLNLINFILLFTDQKLTQTFQSFTIRTDLNDQTIKCIQKLQNLNHQFTTYKNFMDRFRPTQAQKIHFSLESALTKFISIRTNILTRSQLTLYVIQQVQQSCFMLFIKILNTPHHLKAFLNKIRNSMTLKTHIKIGLYFLGKGCDLCISSIYESAVLMLISLIDKNQKNLNFINSQLTSLPSHLFKNIPLLIKNTIYDLMAVICLYSLVEVKQGSHRYSRFNFNRLPTLKLLIVLINEIKVTSSQITELLQQVCLQVKIGLIQRAFLTQLIDKYTHLIRQKIRQNKRIDIMRQKSQGFANKFLQKIRTKKSIQKASQLISVYTKQSSSSQMILKYLISGIQPYRIKYLQKKYVINQKHVIEQFQKDESFEIIQYRMLFEKFSYQMILKKKVLYKHFDKILWNKILPRLIEQHNLQGEQVRSDECQSNNSKRRQQLVGQMRVIMQIKKVNILINKQVNNELGIINNNESPIRNNNKQQKNQYYQTQQQIYNQTTQQSKVQEFKLQMKLKQIQYQQQQQQTQQQKQLKQQQKQQKQSQQSKQQQKQQNINTNNISLVFQQDQQIQDNQNHFQYSQLQINPKSQYIDAIHKLSQNQHQNQYQN